MSALLTDVDALIGALAAMTPRRRWAVIAAALEAAEALRITIPGAVVSKNRALRFSGERAFRTAESHAYQASVAWEARAAMRSRPPLEGPLAVALTVRAPDRRRLADADNSAKSPLDGMRGIAYGDDGQIDALMVRRLIVPGMPAALLVALECIG